MNQEKLNDNNKAFLRLVKEFIESYAVNHEAMPLNEWLSSELQSHMPEKSPSEIEAITHEIISSIELTKSKREALDKAIKCGMTKEGWFAREVKKLSKNAENEYKLTKDLYTTAIKAQANILNQAIDNEAIANALITPNEAARQIENAAVLGSVVDAEVCNDVGEVLGDKESEHSEFIAESLRSDNDTGMKVAAVGALRSAIEKGALPVLPEEASNSVCAGLAYMATEKLKASLKKLPVIDIVEELERNAIAVAAGMMISTKGASIGASLGLMLSPFGAAVGGIIGAGTGYIAGSKVSRIVLKQFQEVRKKVLDKIETYVAPVFMKAVETVKSVGRKVFSWLFG